MSKQVALIVALVLIVIGVFAVSRVHPETVSQESLSAVDFEKALRENADAVLVDVRTAEEYQSGHISGAINVDFQAPDFQQRIQVLDHSKPYYLYCHSGRRSGAAKTIFKNQGFAKVFDLRGGISEYPELLSFSRDPQIAVDVGDTTLDTYVGTFASSSLTQEEIDGLLYMREEEKLARDVYRALFAKWNLKPFSNIFQSEETHMSAVKTLLDRYSVPDPVGSSADGVFTNAHLQSLYTDLVMQGSLSEVEALQVGARIEDLDIKDLEDRSATTEKTDILQVYESLMKGSRNHLRTFTRQLSSRGGDYKPEYISASAYQSIVTTDKETGAGVRSWGAGN